MTNYLINMTVCSGYLIAIYLLLLEREKMHLFNRFYLIFSIIASFLIPLINVSITVSHDSVPDLGYLTDESLKMVASGSAVALPKQSVIPSMILIGYLIISFYLLFKFVINIFSIKTKINRNEVISYLGAKLVLTSENDDPHSFSNFIFINKSALESSTIKQEVLTHELTHVKQHHSIDIIFLELLKIFCWFNPFIYLYRKSVQLNHEFLADAAVITAHRDIYAYQQLLLAKASQQASPFLTSPFNYLVTKKRLLMMTKKTSRHIALCKTLAILPFFAGAIAIFSIKVQAQEPAKSKVDRFSFPSTKEGATYDVITEYQILVIKYKSKDSAWWKGFKALTPSDRERMETLFKQMNRYQQESQAVVFRAPIGPRPRVVPTKAQLIAWKDSKMYGVWINEKRVRNNVLANYSNTDFALAHVSKLSKNAVNYGKHYYQVSLTTTNEYQHYYDQTMSAVKSDTAIIMFRGYTINSRRR